MPRKSGKSKASKSKKKDKTNPSSAAQSYSGPLRLPRVHNQTETTTVELIWLNICTASAGGIVNNVFAVSLNQFSEYSSFANLYDENRLLACTCEFLPLAKNSGNYFSGSAQNSAMLVGCIDRDSNTALTTLSGGMTFESAKLFNSSSHSKWIYKMSGSEDAGFSPVSTTVSTNFKFYGAGLSNSASYGYFLLRGLWQLRGRI